MLHHSPIKKALLTLIRELLNLRRLEQVAVLNEGLLGHLVREVSVNVAHVHLVLDLGDVGRRYRSGQQIVPVDGLKERVSLDLLDIQTIFWIALQEASKQARGRWLESWQDLHVLLGDTAQNLMSALVALHGLLFEGVDPADHLVGEHAKTPPVDREAMASSLDDLRCKILGRTTESIRHAILRLLDLAQAKICQFEMAL